MLYHTQALQLLAIDVETANRQDGRICQVGIAQLQGSSVSVVLDELVDPKGNFLKEFTEQYHGITKEMVRGRGEFDSLHPRLHDLLANRFVFSVHPGFPWVIRAVQRPFTPGGLNCVRRRSLPASSWAL